MVGQSYVVFYESVQEYETYAVSLMNNKNIKIAYLSSIAN